MARDVLCNTVPAHIQRHSPCQLRQAACGCLHSSFARPAMRCVEPRSSAILLHHSIHHRLCIACRRAGNRVCARLQMQIVASVRARCCWCGANHPDPTSSVLRRNWLLLHSPPSMTGTRSKPPPLRPRDGDGPLHPTLRNCSRCPLMALLNFSTCCSADEKGSRKPGCCSPTTIHAESRHKVCWKGTGTLPCCVCHCHCRGIELCLAMFAILQLIPAILHVSHTRGLLVQQELDLPSAIALRCHHDILLRISRQLVTMARRGNRSSGNPQQRHPQQLKRPAPSCGDGLAAR